MAHFIRQAAREVWHVKCLLHSGYWVKLCWCLLPQITVGASGSQNLMPAEISVRMATAAPNRTLKISAPSSELNWESPADSSNASSMEASSFYDTCVCKVLHARAKTVNHLQMLLLPLGLMYMIHLLQNLWLMEITRLLGQRHLCIAWLLNRWGRGGFKKFIQNFWHITQSNTELLTSSDCEP